MYIKKNPCDSSCSSLNEVAILNMRHRSHIAQLTRSTIKSALQNLIQNILKVDHAQKVKKICRILLTYLYGKYQAPFVVLVSVRRFFSISIYPPPLFFCGSTFLQGIMDQTVICTTYAFTQFSAFLAACFPKDFFSISSYEYIWHPSIVIPKLPLGLWFQQSWIYMSRFFYKLHFKKWMNMELVPNPTFMGRCSHIRFP